MRMVPKGSHPLFYIAVCLEVTFAAVSVKAMIRAIKNRRYCPRGYKHFIFLSDSNNIKTGIISDASQTPRRGEEHPVCQHR